jgi:hypothetical protein
MEHHLEILLEQVWTFQEYIKFVIL